MLIARKHLLRLPLLALACGAAQAQSPQPSVCLYEHVNFKGRSTCLGGEQASLGPDWDRQASSVRIPAGLRLRLYSNTNFTGSQLALTGNQANLVQRGFNDRARSLRIERVAAPPPPGSARIASVQFAQSMLFDSGDSALVLVSGKPALLKVNAVSSTAGASKPTGTVRVENTLDGRTQELLLTPPSASLPSQVPQVPSFADSYTVTLPADAVRPGLRVVVRLGNGAATTLTPRVGSGVPIRFTPISVRIGNTAGQVPPDLGAHLGALFPVASVGVGSRPAYTSTRVSTVPSNENDWFTAMRTVLGELADLHRLESASPQDYYMGYVPKRTSGMSGIGYLRGNAAVSFDMPSSPAAVRDTTAHELGHNLSLPHAPCGGPDLVDPNYPYPNANLGMPGRYVWPYLAHIRTFVDPRPNNRHDLMSYCGGSVLSDYNYRRVQMHLSPSDRISALAFKGHAQPEELLLVSGELHTDGRALLHPVKTFVGRSDDRSGGSHVLRVVSDKGRFDYPFTPSQLAHAINHQHFSLGIPHPGVVRSLTVLHQGEVLAQMEAAPSALAPAERQAQTQVDAASPASVQVFNGSLLLRWNSARQRYASLVWLGSDGQRLVLTQDAQGGQVTLDGTGLPEGGQFELILSDGLNATRQLLPR